MRVGTGHAEFENNILILSKLERPKQNPKAEFQLCNFVEMQQQVYGRRFPRALLPGRHKPYVPRPSGTNLSTLQQLAERALISRRQQSPDAIAQALALEAAADSLFEPLLAMIANGSANDASISAFEVAVRHTYQNCDISDSTAHRDITAKTGGNDSRADAVETTTGTAASHGKREVVVGDEEISRLRTRSMRVRILQQDPSLPCLDPIITRMVDHASRDPVLAAAIQHVSGENGHLWPNQDQLLLVRRFIDAGQDQSVHHGNGSFAPRDEMLPAKVLPGQWPPHITLSYRCYLTSSRRKSKMTAARSGAPLVKYSDHPDAEIDPFHDRREVPYPLSLLPKKTRHALRTDNPDGAVCSCCRRPISPSSCQRKLFLVAERLACPAGYWGLKAREQNEKALWAANYQLGIEEPVEVSSQETFFGSRLSNRNQWYPFTNREEAEMVMLVVEQAHILTNVSWAAWKSMAEKELQGQDPSRRTAGDDGGSLGPSRTVLQEKSGNIQSSPHSSASRSKSAGTPASSCPSSSSASAKPNHSAADRFDMSLPDFYRILDKVERISPMATRFLEAYAERLARESCGSCWLEENVLQEEELADVGE
ncbi:hypothetical protein Tdes44962_MAKER07867 [Teratosphaeria destructans]|uniref:Uncharacterized protein n=1 Tax=Teratosphaeria destructans TaxID=418781 RepID=A0A9W7SY03_9PEZI|nr:hypothetical protein Tdes44962_MAKER07867 [Teratosphaeria destructans]